MHVCICECVNEFKFNELLQTKAKWGKPLTHFSLINKTNYNKTVYYGFWVVCVYELARPEGYLQIVSL